MDLPAEARLDGQDVDEEKQTEGCESKLSALHVQGVLYLRTTTSQKYKAVPRRARI